MDGGSGPAGTGGHVGVAGLERQGVGTVPARRGGRMGPVRRGVGTAPRRTRRGTRRRVGRTWPWACRRPARRWRCGTTRTRRSRSWRWAWLRGERGGEAHPVRLPLWILNPDTRTAGGLPLGLPSAFYRLLPTIPRRQRATDTASATNRTSSSATSRPARGRSQSSSSIGDRSVLGQTPVQPRSPDSLTMPIHQAGTVVSSGP